VLLAAVNGAVQGALASNRVSAVTAAAQVAAGVSPVRSVLNNYSASEQACQGKLNCVEALDKKVAGTLNTFAGQLRGIAMPSQAVAANAALASAVSDTAVIFAKLGTATSATQYISEAQSSGLQQAVNRINQAYDDLGTALGS
jgi:type VI protein secretion system component VasK